MKLLKIIKDFVIVMILIGLIFTMFLGAALQTSYRYNPPTAAERAEHPFIVGFLAGK